MSKFSWEFYKDVTNTLRNKQFTKELQNNLIIFPAHPDFVIAVLFPGVICIFPNHQGKSNFIQSDKVLFLNSTEV